MISTGDTLEVAVKNQNMAIIICVFMFYAVSHYTKLIHKYAIEM